MTMKHRIVSAIGGLSLLATAIALVLTGRESAGGSGLPKGLPAWFNKLDENGDGQIALSEWRKSGKTLSEFRQYDLNDDGIITADEVLQFVKKPIELKLVGGRVNYNGAIDEAADEPYRGKKFFKIFIIKFEKGKTYQIDHMSKAFDAYLYLEDPDGELLAQDDDGGEGLNSRIVHHAAEHGTYRLIATCLGNARGGAFSFSVRNLDHVGGLPKGLPSWFKNLDKNEDGQIGLNDWRKAGKELNEFPEFDRNDDGLITAEEVLQLVKKPVELKLEGGRANYQGAIDETPDEKYRGKKSFKIFTIKMEQGRTYQIDLISKSFQAFLHLEDSDGNRVMENSARNIGENSRLVFRTDRTETFRLIATSLGGFRTGAFLLSVRVLDHFGGILPKGLPSWFIKLDTDEDGQVALHEWRKGGKSLAEFRQYDLNDDGFITAEEVLKSLNRKFELRLEGGRANYDGAIEETTDERYRGKKSFKIITIRMEEGQTYEIDLVSQAYYAFLYLEDAQGELLAQHNSGGRGLIARIVHRATMTGTYRLIATSQDGHRTGECTFSVRVRDD